MTTTVHVDLGTTVLHAQSGETVDLGVDTGAGGAELTTTTTTTTTTTECGAALGADFGAGGAGFLELNLEKAELLMVKL